MAGPKDLACSVSPSRSEFKWADVPSERIARSDPVSNRSVRSDLFEKGTTYVVLLLFFRSIMSF